MVEYPDNQPPAGSDRKPSKAYMSRVASILVCLSKGINSLTDIADTCKLSKATVHRLLKSLVEANFAVLDPACHRYYLGGLIHYVATNTQITHQYLISRASEEMTRLADLSSETVNLGILVGSLHSSLYEIPSKQPLKITMEIMRPAPVFTGGRIKVLFSQLRDEDIEAILKGTIIVPMTENTVTDKAQLMAQVRQVRKQGYAISYGERTAGAASISAPILNYGYPVSLSILGPESRIRPHEKRLIKELLVSATRVSETIKGIKTGIG
jgi:DNA-binding IclR family transcriptional regulator